MFERNLETYRNINITVEKKAGILVVVSIICEAYLAYLGNLNFINTNRLRLKRFNLIN